MDLNGLAGVIAALGGGGGILAAGAAVWKAAKAAAKNEVLAEQAQKTIAEKDEQIARLWRLLDSQTTPEVKP